MVSGRLKYAFVALALMLPATAGAQAPERGTIVGEAVDVMTGLPVAGVRIEVQGTKLRTKTDSLGGFRLEGVAPGVMLVRADVDGYARMLEQVVVDAGWATGVRFELEPMAILLDALMIETDQTEGAKKTRVRMDDSSVGRSISEHLAGRVPGLHVIRTSGTTGVSPRIMIRGPNSISLSNTPAVYVDGIRVNVEVRSTNRGGNTYWGLDLLDSASVDRIEVLRGPAAAAQYGGDAASGVILIYTKRGD